MYIKLDSAWLRINSFLHYRQSRHWAAPLFYTIVRAVTGQPHHSTQSSEPSQGSLTNLHNRQSRPRAASLFYNISRARTEQAHYSTPPPEPAQSSLTNLHNCQSRPRAASLFYCIARAGPEQPQYSTASPEPAKSSSVSGWICWNAVPIAWPTQIECYCWAYSENEVYNNYRMCSCQVTM